MFRILKKEMNQKVEYDEYLHALYECKEIAESEVNLLVPKVDECKDILMKSLLSLNLFIDKSKSLEEDSEELITQLEKFNGNIKSNLDKGILSIENSIERKKKNLSNFTVTLFGRTKAGKSTIREALTNGNGETIGKGAQRTTQEVKQYFWNNLRIIDTPGISAYEGEEDVKVAESIIDESDVILFLVTNDSIQETEFEKLVQLKSQNKPVIIILNVKVDLDNEVHRRRFLKNSREVVSLNGQAGNVERIKEYSKKYLGSDNLEIIPIHAMSAYLSSKVVDKDLKKELYNASNFNKVKFMLREMIVNQGKQKRVLSFRDDFIYYLNSLENIYWNSYKEIKPRIQYIKEKHVEIGDWFNSFKSKGQTIIDREVEKIFTELISEVDSFVDRYAGDKDAGRIWSKKLKSYNIQEKVNNIYEELFEEAKRYLNEFARQIQFDSNNLKFSNDFSKVGDLKKGILGRAARWGSVVLDVAFAVSLTNFWNPAGWVSALVGIGGLIISVFSWIWGDDSKKYDKKKSEIKVDMKRDINKKAKDINKQLRNAFEKNIINNLYKQINVELAKNIDLLHKYLDTIKESAISIRNKVDSENISLFKMLFRLTFNMDFSCLIIKVAREQGVMSKVLTTDETLKESNSRRLLESILGERIIYVEFTNEPNELLKRAIFPAKTDNVIFEMNNKDISIKAKKENLKHVIGRNGRNIKLTNRLFPEFNISVEEI